MIQTVYDKILNYTGTATIPCVLVGQKSDLHAQRYVCGAHAQASVRGRGQGACAAAQVCVDRDECAAQCERRCVLRWWADAVKVFDLMLGEIEKASNPGAGEAPASMCSVM